MSEFNASGSDCGLLIVHQNIRSFNKNYDSFSVLISSIARNVDVIILTETWFTKGLCATIPGYSDYHTFRLDRIGGGVSVYVRSGLVCNMKREHTYVSDNIEICTVEIFPNNLNLKQSVVVSGIYRPPDSPVQLFNDKINDIVASYVRKSAVMIGDFNIDILNLELCTDFVNVMYSNSFYPLINIPTRVTNTSSKCIDHIWFNNFNVDFSGSFEIGITDHYPIFAIFNFIVDNKPISKKIRDHSDRSMSELSTKIDELVSEYNTNVMLHNVNSKADWFCKGLFGIYDRCCPVKIKNVSLKKLLKPWITNELQDFINQKHRLFKQYKNNSVTFDTYNRYKNWLTNRLKVAKSVYYFNKFQRNRFNVKKNWQTINTMLNRKKSRFIQMLLLIME